ncbi:MAG: alpha-glucan family phosphorylase [Gaiellaceae bacterium MAG52_C11]|nr:alpha-glucan family phosphorylase [Candidatus Gaiellasilicea maunaloa]
MTADAVSWWERARARDEGLRVAYFSMEFGLHERLPIYSGGLGVLAGDHLKAAADLGLPLVGVGLLYRGGYFRQGIDAAGRQTEDYQPVDPEAAGLEREPVSVEVDVGGTAIEAAVWRKDVGSVPLYLLEVDWLTDALYGGDREHRIRQELLLGVGGIRALAALGIEPTVFHLNEGHSAFLQIERVRALVAGGLETKAALEHVRRSSVFTTHTPVPAGNEVFGAELVARYVGPLAAEAGLGEEALLDLGRSGDEPGFGLTPLALRLSSSANGVSGLHGEVAREMWEWLWPGQETPIGHVTNGVHLGTWLDPALAELLRSAGVRPEAPPDEASWESARVTDPEALWRVHAAAKARLAERAGIERDLLTIGFARRFATYKRAGLVFSDVERLLALPVQLVVAGKAHPADAPGKDVMQEIVELARERRAQGRVVFLENYDIGLARTLVRGCDVWLNTPTRPLEASGTSGMKAAVNGVLNLSVLDGWWAEGYSAEVGWAIDGVSDEADREQLYRLLEHEIVPTFTGDRERWVTMMQESIAQLAPRFSMHRAVIEYVERYYLPAHEAARSDS